MIGVIKNILDYLNEWYKDDWSLFKDYTAWTTES